MPISIFKPTIKRRDMDAVLTALVEDKLGPGSIEQELVQRCSEYIGVSGGLALREYKRAVDLVLDALEIGNGNTVILSPLSPATYHSCLLERGVDVVFADVDPNTGCLHAPAIEKHLAHRPAACIVHSPFGFVPDMNAVAELGVPIVEDISTSLGGHCLERKLGSFGRYSVVSLEENKIITSGGGALVLAREKRDLGQLRIAADSLDETCRLPDMNASLAQMQIKYIEEFIAKRRDIAAVYNRALMKGKHRTFTQDGDNENVFFSFPVILDGSTREAIKYSRSKRVTIKEAFTDSVISINDIDIADCPNAQMLSLRCVLFPLYPMLSRDEVEQIAKVISSLP